MGLQQSFQVVVPVRGTDQAADGGVTVCELYRCTAIDAILRAVMTTDDALTRAESCTVA